MGCNQFASEERVKKGAEKLQKYLNAKQQGRLDGFFTVKSKEKPLPKGKAEKGKSATKRKVYGCYNYSPLISYAPLGRCRERREWLEKIEEEITMALFIYNVLPCILFFLSFNAIRL